MIISSLPQLTRLIGREYVLPVSSMADLVEHHVGTGTIRRILTHINPPYAAWGVDKHRRRERDAAREEVIGHSYVVVDIREDREGGARFGGELGRPLGAVDADHQESRVRVLTLLIRMGQLAHLFFAVRSPPAAVEHQQNGLAAAKIAKRHSLAVTRGQRKVWRLRPEGDALRGLFLGHTIHLRAVSYPTQCMGYDEMRECKM